MKGRLLHLRRRIARRLAIRGLQSRPELWADILAYKKASPSTGCSWSDLWTLYRTVRERRPAEVLELGPGLSTVAIGHALLENARDGRPGRITALEEMDFYLEAAQRLLPPAVAPLVEFVQRPRVEYVNQIFRGVGYQDVPVRQYDFVFVDGPHHIAPSDDHFVFDFDLINIVERTQVPVFAIVDYRLTSCFVFQQLFGINKARFDAVLELGFIGPCVRGDILTLSLTDLTHALERDARLFGNTTIRLR